ncbi:hypothetical protein BGX34_011251, partial [Mortierella sp. NVP85]
LSIGKAPQVIDLEEIASSPTGSTFSTQPFESFPRRESPTSPVEVDGTITTSVLFGSTNSGLEYIPDTRNSQPENETKVKDLEMKLRRSRDQTLLYAKKNCAMARESQEITAKAIKRAMQIQNKVQAVLTQNYDLHENPVPRLFIVLPVLMDPSAKASSTPSDQRKFRVHFLCECGQHTRPLPSTGMNHIHFVEDEGYEIEHPIEFFEKYGAFIRGLSHLISKGVHCGTISIPPLLPSQQKQRNDTDSSLRTSDVEQEILQNQILDTRLAETIDYLDSLETLNSPDNESSDDDAMEFFNGTNIKQLQAYVKIPSGEEQSPGGLYRIITSRGFVKWICEDHYRSSIHIQNEIQFRQEVASLKGHYDLRTGRARIQLGSAQDANQFYRFMSKAHNLHELDIALRWPFTESDFQRLVQTIQDSRIRALALDGGKLEYNPAVKLRPSKKYDPLLRIIYGCKIGSLKVSNIPSMLLRTSTKPPQSLTHPYTVKVLHLENVGVVDFSASDKQGMAHSVIGASLMMNNNNTRTAPLAFLRNLVTYLQALTEISVPGMGIRDEGVALITGQVHLEKSLRKFNLYNNAISPEGGRHLANFISREKAIVHLDLGMNPIGDEVLVLVIDALGPRLSVLNLEGTGFRDNAANALDRMIETYNSPSKIEPQLEYLNLAGNGWTTSSIQALGRIIMRMRLEIPPPSSPSITASGPQQHDKPTPLEMGAAESFMVINSLIRTAQLGLPTDKPWHQQPDCLSSYAALTASKESYGFASLKAQDSIAVNSRLKVLRISDGVLTEGAAQYIISLLDVNVLTKMDLRRCVKLIKPREILTILTRIYPNSSYDQEEAFRRAQQGLPQAPTPYGVIGSPQNCLRFLHLNSTGVDDHVARLLAQELGSGYCSLERLDIGSNHLTYQGINLLLDGLCNNTSLQHLNLGQNFMRNNTVYASTALTKATGEALRRFMTTNKTLQILYFVCADLDVVAQGLTANKTIRSLVFDRLEGSLNDVEAFARALAVNQTLMRLKVYDNRHSPFLEAFYGQPQQPQQQQQQQAARYADPFKDFKQEAIKTIERGISFNHSLIEIQWPEMFDRLQPCTERLEAMLARNMSLLKNGAPAGNGYDVASPQEGNGGGTKGRGMFRGNRISRGLSVLSTTSSYSNGTDHSSSSSSLSPPTSPKDTRNQGGSVIPSFSGPMDGYSYSIHSNSSITSIDAAVNGGGGSVSSRRNTHGSETSSRWDERKLSLLELSPSTLKMLRNTLSRDQQQPPQPQPQPRQQLVQQNQSHPPKATEPHILHRLHGFKG